jgi:hypothetical protein
VGRFPRLLDDPLPVLMFTPGETATMIWARARPPDFNRSPTRTTDFNWLMDGTRPADSSEDSRRGFLLKGAMIIFVAELMVS